MLSKETFCEALRKIQAQKDRDEQFSKALTLMGDGHFVFEGGAPLLAALLDVLKEAVNDQYDYISWWLYEAAPGYEVWTEDEKTKWCLKEPCGNNGTDHVIGKSSRPTSLPRPKKMRYNKRTTYTRPGKSVIPAGRRCCHEFIRGKEK